MRWLAIYFVVVALFGWVMVGIYWDVGDDVGPDHDPLISAGAPCGFGSDEPTTQG